MLGAFALWTGVDPRRDAINVSISPWLLALVVALSLGYVYGIVRRADGHANRPVLARPVMGLVGAGGVAQTLIAPRGIAFAGGERGRRAAPDRKLQPGSAVRVVAVDGLELIVEPGGATMRSTDAGETPE